MVFHLFSEENRLGLEYQIAIKPAASTWYKTRYKPSSFCCSSGSKGCLLMQQFDHGVKVRDAIKLHRQKNNLDIESDTAPNWTCKLGPCSLKLPNFKWRKQTICKHDLHHIITQIPCSMTGECRIAAWEYSSGSFPNLYAACFCFPLILLGLIIMPKKTIEAYKWGKKCKNLYPQNFSYEEPLCNVLNKVIPATESQVEN